MKNILNARKNSLKSILMSLVIFSSSVVSLPSAFEQKVAASNPDKRFDFKFEDISNNKDLKKYWLDKLLFPENKPENKDVETNDRNKKSNEKDIEKRDEEPSKK